MKTIIFPKEKEFRIKCKSVKEFGAVQHYIHKIIFKKK
jgi:hypothetical protein